MKVSSINTAAYLTYTCESDTAVCLDSDLQWVERERGCERTKLARRLLDSCMSDSMKETGNMTWKTAPWSAMSTTAHQISAAKKHSPPEPDDNGQLKMDMDSDEYWHVLEVKEFGKLT